MELRPFKWCSLQVSFCTWHSCSSWLFKQYSTSRRKKPSWLFSPTTSAKPKKKETTLSQKSTGLLAWSSVLPGAIPSPRYIKGQAVMEMFRTTHPLIPCWFKWLMSLKVSQSMGVTLKLWLRWVWCLRALMLCMRCPEPHGWSPVAPPWLIHARSGRTQPSWLCSPWAQRISGAKFKVRMRSLLAILLFPYLGLEEVLDRIPSALYTDPQLHRDWFLVWFIANRIYPIQWTQVFL